MSAHGLDIAEIAPYPTMAQTLTKKSTVNRSIIGPLKLA